MIVYQQLLLMIIELCSRKNIILLFFFKENDTPTSLTRSLNKADYDNFLIYIYILVYIKPTGWEQFFKIYFNQYLTKFILIIDIEFLCITALYSSFIQVRTI